MVKLKSRCYLPLATGIDHDLHDQVISIGSFIVTSFTVRSIVNILKKKVKWQLIV